MAGGAFAKAGQLVFDARRIGGVLQHVADWRDPGRVGGAFAQQGFPKREGAVGTVDFGEHQPTNSIKSLFLEHLRPGDIFTHTFAYGPKDRETVVDDEGIVKPFIFDAQKKGILFDVGHGGGAFFWRQAVPAIKQGFKPDVISTDLHSDSMNGGMKDMANVMSKFLNIGLTLEEVIEKSTASPARVINRPDLGNLSIGSEADVAVFSLKKGEFGFTDVRRNVLKGTQKLDAELTLRAGKIVWDLNGVSGQIWDSPQAITK